MKKLLKALDGLRERLKEYSKLGAKFTKWRGVYNISKDYPSKLSITFKRTCVSEVRCISARMWNGSNSRTRGLYGR